MDKKRFSVLPVERWFNCRFDRRPVVLLFVVAQAGPNR
jgi:hypothetical protein